MCTFMHKHMNAKFITIMQFVLALRWQSFRRDTVHIYDGKSHSNTWMKTLFDNVEMTKITKKTSAGGENMTIILNTEKLPWQCWKFLRNLLHSLSHKFISKIDNCHFIIQDFWWNWEIDKLVCKFYGILGSNLVKKTPLSLF